MTRHRLLRVAACAVVVLAVGLVVSFAQQPPSPGRAAALTSTGPTDGAAAAPGGLVDVTISHRVSLSDGRELADALNCSVEIRAAAGPGAARRPSTVDAATDAAGNAEVAAGSAHQHGVDPVSAALLAIDGVVALAVVALLLRRPTPRPSRPPS